LVTFVGIDAPMDVNLSHALVRFEDADAACAIPEGQRMTNREGQEREVLLGAVEMGGLYAFGYGYTMVSRADEARLISAFLRGTCTDEDPKVEPYRVLRRLFYLTPAPSGEAT